MPGEGPSNPGPRNTAPSDPSPPRSTRRLFWVLVRLAIAAGLLAYLAKSGMIDLRALSKPFTAWPIALAALALILMDIALMALKLSWLFRPRGLHLTWTKSFQLTLIGYFFAQFLPGSAGGDLAKLFYAAKDSRGRRSEIITVSLFDRAIGMFSLLLMPLLFAPIFYRLIADTPAFRILLATSTILAAILLAGFLACVFYQSFVERVAQALLGFLPWQDWRAQVIQTIASYRHNLGTVAAALGLALLANSLSLIVIVLAVVVLNPAGFYPKICLIAPLGFVANNLPFTPGGLGVGEASFNALFAVAGLTGGADVLLCWRVWTALVRLLGLAFYLRGIERVFHGRRPGNPALPDQEALPRSPVGSLKN
jgi:glycosyltransferase 2 family protein